MDVNRSRTRRRAARGAFTLIELLVVVAILVLLLAMLSPSLRRALDVAKDAKCRSNEHQLQTAFIQYTNDNRMRGFGRMHNFDDFWMGLLGQYTNELDLIRVCPIATVERKEYGYGAARLAWTGAAWPGSCRMNALADRSWRKGLSLPGETCDGRPCPLYSARMHSSRSIASESAWRNRLSASSVAFQRVDGSSSCTTRMRLGKMT